jgi:2-oxoisovalerate dehydrogenase E1 component alpha subunit
VHGELRSQEEIEKLKKTKDPLTLYQNKLLKQGVLAQEDIERIDKEIDAELEKVERFCEESPHPDRSILERAVYAD